MDPKYFLPFHIIKNGYAYNDEDLKINQNKIFLNSFHLETHEFKYDLHDIEYKHNKQNYRSPEFAENIDAIFAGCSNTYGVGLVEEARWSNIIANRMNFSFVNLAIPGASAALIVSEILHYIKVYGKPKYIFCMFPDLARITTYVKRDLNAPYDGWGDYGLTQTHMMSHGDLSQRPKYIKKPYAYEDVLSVETSYFYSLKAIQMLEQFCSAMNIKLHWGVFWDMDADMLSNLCQNDYGYYESFIGTEPGRWDRRHNDGGKDQYMVRIEHEHKNSEEVELNCHEEYRHVHPKYFDMASDIEHGIEGAHYGYHRNLHIAEKFCQLLGIEL